MFRSLILAVAFALAGCASQIMQGYVGRPMQAAMAQYGPPANAFDMGDGRRAFQWQMDSTYQMPTTVTNSGNVAAFGNAAWWTQNATISGGQTIQSRCLYTLYTRWSEGANAWVVEGFEKPRWACE